MIFFVVISPYLVLLKERTGKWQLLEEAGSTYVSAQGLAYGDTAAFDAGTWGLDPASGEVYYFSDTSEGQGLVDAIIANPAEFARRLRANVEDLVAGLTGWRLLGWPLIALALLGLFNRPWDGRRLRGELLLAVVLAGPLSFVLFFIQDRYLAAALLPALIWVGGGAAWLGAWLAQTWESVRAEGQRSRGAGEPGSQDAPPPPRPLAPFRGVPLLFLALALLWQQPRLWAALQETHSFQPGHLAAAEMLRAAGAATDAVVMSRYPAVAFHAGAAWAPTPSAAWPDVATYAAKRHAVYLVVDEWETRLRPALKPLLDPATAPVELRHLATVDAGRGPVVVYEFRNR